MRKLYSLSLIFLLLCVGMFASGVQDKTPEGPVTLVFWSNYDQSPDFVQAFAETANTLLPRIGLANVKCRAEAIPYDSFIEKFVSAFTAGQGPDMFDANNAEVWAEDGGKYKQAVAWPNDISKAWESRLAPMYVQWGTFKGKRYGFPTEGNIQMLYINTDYFKQAGLDINTPNTLDEFLSSAQKLTVTDSNGKITRSGYAPRYSGQGLGVADKFLSIVHIFGGRMLNEGLNKAEGYINGPDSVAAFQFYYDLVYKHKVVNLEFGKPEEAFQQGLTAMAFREGWLAFDIQQKAPNIKFKVLPYISHKKNFAPSSTLPGAIMISKDSKYKDICFKLVKAWAEAGPEADVMFHKSAGYPPVLKATYSMSNEWFASLPFAEALQKTLDKKLGPEYFFPGLNDISYMLGEEIVSCLRGTPPQEAANKAAKRIDEVLSSQ